MSVNWKRHFEMQLLNKDGEGIALTDFKVTFNIDWFNISSDTRTGLFRIYNLSATTVNLIMGDEFSRIRVIAGYDGLETASIPPSSGSVQNVNSGDTGQADGHNYGMIFDGEIIFTLTGKENPIDSYLLIQAADSHRAFATTITSTTLAAGYTAADASSALMKDFNANGVTEGNTPPGPPTVFPRGRVLFGMTRHLMDNVAKQCNATWMFVDGKREMVAKDAVYHDAIELNSETGLIGMPQQTIGTGVNVRCLINPNIGINKLIKLNQGSVMQTQLNQNDVAMANGQRITQQTLNGNVTADTKAQPASIATDGVYLVQGIMYTGDTRGQAWYMDMMCEARGAQDLKSQDAFNRGG